MIDYKKHLKSALISSLGYGLGFVIGVVLIGLIFDSGILDSVTALFEKQHLLSGIIALFLVVILGGGLAGAIGGLSLWYALSLDDWKRPVSRSAVGFGFGFGIVLMPITILLSALSTYNAGDASSTGFIFGVGVIGVLFGFISGLMSATLPYRTNDWRLTGVLSLAFGVGGLVFGLGLWNYFYVLYETGVGTAQLLLAYFIFGAVGGLVMGWTFSRDLEKAKLEGIGEDVVQANIFYRAGQWFKSTKFYQKRGFWGTLIFFVIIFILTRLIALSPLNFSEAHLSDYLPSQTIGVHWSDPFGVSSSGIIAGRPSIVSAGDVLAATWEQDTESGSDIFFTVSIPGEMDALEIWSDPINISNTPDSISRDPQISLDSQGLVHVVWAEASADQSGHSQIFYASCANQGKECSQSVNLSDPEEPACGTGWVDAAPALRINAVNDLMVVWGNLAYSTWKAGTTPPSAPTGCLLEGDDEIASAAYPRLAASRDGNFVIAFEGNQGKVYVARLNSQDGIVGELAMVGEGEHPEVFIDGVDTVHMAWCGTDGQIHFQEQGGLGKMIEFPGCLNRPALGKDADGVLHLLWYANQAKQPSDRIIDSDLIYESRLRFGVWTTPQIVSQVGEAAQPSVTSRMDGRLHMVWAAPERVSVASYQAYACDESDLPDISQVALEIAQSGRFRPEDDIVPFCHNRYDRLLILPNADPAFSDNPPSLNGGFDDVAELIQTAQYEVLFSTMWYNEDEVGGQSPGYILAKGVTALYQKVKANPTQYPRGVTVRILLDNPPEFTLSRLISQVWNVFNDLRRAGLPVMNDPEIGWKLEIANYAGSWPHGHTKMVVIDGKTAVAAGFNYQHKHLAEDHPSGLGGGQYDLALQMTGPVAQATQLSFDDLWYGANRIDCPEFGSDSPLWWVTCERNFATTEHVPEVLKYFLADADSNAFAMHRTVKYEEADATLTRTIENAEKSLDILQVNFTLELICNLNVLFEVCDFNNALGYMEAMMHAIETNQVKTRVLIKSGPIEAVESQVAVDAFREALEQRGLSDLVEFRFFDTSTHAKAVLIDDQFLIIGSQNFHYSAYGSKTGLTEFNIGTDDHQAVQEFKRFFDYQWAIADPVPDKR